MKTRKFFLSCLAVVLVFAITRWIAGITPSQLPDERYYAALYFCHLRAEDSVDKNSVDFQVHWPAEVSPYGKGSGPVRIRINPDGSKEIIIVGIKYPDGLPLTITAGGWKSLVIKIEPDMGGVLTEKPSKITTVSLVRQ